MRKELLSNKESNPTMPSPGPGGTEEMICWEFQNVNLSVDVPLKNDIIVTPDYAVWNPNDDPYDDSGPNRYYDDVPADGGYNHFELRRHKRAYTLSGVFQAGDPAPPMQEAAQWLEFVVFQ